ncbi:hypothetical protein M5689_019150 [Euphorbia peplus]|nr:hypothetical protein M5689_019150 [Euphorbia peplus]
MKELEQVIKERDDQGT